MPPYLIFVANAIGFIVAAPLTHTLENRLGRHRSYTLSVNLAIIGYVMIACHPPFLMVVVSFFLLEFGMMLSIALNNVSCARLPNATTALGCDPGTYGIGDVVSVAILGVVLGAVYPCSTPVFVKLLPRKIWIAGLSFIGALGSSGGTFFPFLRQD